MNSFSWKCLAVLALALFVLGCGPGGPKLYKAGGTVTYNNAPVEGAMVTFLYDDGNFANGSTDAAGKFQLVYVGRPGGAALGKCKVGVTKAAAATSASPGAPATTAKPKTEEEWKAEMARKEAEVNNLKKKMETPVAPPKDLLPAKYADPNTSGLTFEVKADEAQNDFKIDLKD